MVNIRDLCLFPCRNGANKVGAHEGCIGYIIWNKIVADTLVNEGCTVWLTFNFTM